MIYERMYSWVARIISSSSSLPRLRDGSPLANFTASIPSSKVLEEASRDMGTMGMRWCQLSAKRSQQSLLFQWMVPNFTNLETLDQPNQSFRADRLPIKIQLKKVKRPLFEIARSCARCCACFFHIFFFEFIPKQQKLEELQLLPNRPRSFQHAAIKFELGALDASSRLSRPSQ